MGYNSHIGICSFPLYSGARFEWCKHSQMLDTLKVNNGLGKGVAYGYSFSRFHENIYIEYAVPLRHIERANAVVIAA